MHFVYEGKTVWQCRYRNYVSYAKDGSDLAESMFHRRFMVDMNMYKKMHPAQNDNALEKASHNRGKHSHVDSSIGEIDVNMTQDDPPSDDEFLMCLPSTVKGFDMKNKEWRLLEVAFIQRVEWNDKAFEDLVIEPKTKSLIKAVVTNRVRSEEGADVIEGKGNGLFILLHGGPGTGKTLTAESVAEIAKRPLYKVTCGDLGTKAHDVEKYLETVSLLGKTWGCVVLLDEADVFLEQRSLANLERNALVSVFLRVLEYYDGILTLTTNRVGTFDEAFKSRIQLNLRYTNLDRDQRLQIWTNFVKRLEEMEMSSQRISGSYGINAAEIRASLSALAEENLNGREIRNILSTARQLSSYEEKPLGYGHLQTVIHEANKFEGYLKQVHHGFSHDEMQHDQMARSHHRL
ncbi:ATPase family AAA domain-containing protein 3 [Colletotrichum orbiculare MAFF 240422]|uniref:ATPase family AAA domain-containing protein 3 n=1 Tax=Colletotrichum orbiculare (strain 104-T / ATCC 96160 / CBS 514.97 / LARS 414 / MAFF 240422) TaxID=1213857 RepID=A0A484FH51_COLOR|nr:ATPase family AAA domain-containing protein 3 [Colletotrichum orbiculare MAFF 240422]